MLRLIALTPGSLPLPWVPCAATDEAPVKVRELLQILGDPKVQRWIAQQPIAPAPALPASAVAEAGDDAMM